MSINAQTLDGNWNEIKGKLRERWGQVSQDDLQKARGNVEQLVGLIERKTGEARGQVEKYLAELTADGSKGVGKVLNMAKDYAGQAVESVEGMASGAAGMARERMDHTGEMIRSRPMESMAVGFGAGLIAGVIIGIALKAR